MFSDVDKAYEFYVSNTDENIDQMIEKTVIHSSIRFLAKYMRKDHEALPLSAIKKIKYSYYIFLTRS